MISVHNFTKRYGDTVAVNNLHFTVKEEAFFALLGPNGAGKSTTIESLSTLKSIDQGTLSINGYTVGQDDAQIRQSIGLVFQYSVLDENLTGEENLMIRGRFYGLKSKELKERLAYLETTLGFGSFKTQRVRTLSGGQRRKLDIARALIHRPRLLMLDEPTTGLDPKSRQDIWQLIMKLKQESRMTLLLTTHYMEEAQDADHVIIMHQGNIVAEDTADALRLKHASDTLRLYPKKGLLKQLKTLGIEHQLNGDIVTVQVPDAFIGHDIVTQCREYLHSFELRKASLDDVFLNLTGETFVGADHG